MINIDGAEGDREHRERVRADCRDGNEKGQCFVEINVGCWEPEQHPIAPLWHARQEHKERM